MTTIRRRSALQIWGDVIFALFLRHIKVQFDDKLGVAWSVISPVLFVFMMSAIRGRIGGDDVNTMPLFPFYVYGFLTFLFFLETLNGVARAIKRNRALFSFRQVQPISAAISVGLFSILSQLAAFGFVFLLMYFMGMEVRIDNPLGVLCAVLLLWIIAVAIGLAVGIATMFVAEVKALVQVITRPLLFISCVIFSIHDIPKDYWYLFEWNPLAQAIELARASAYSSYGPGPMTWMYLSLVALFVTLFSLSFYQGFWKRALARQ